MKKIAIIGGGVAGLSAGIFAQKNGFASTIIEKHHTLGGECTGWDRQGYHIDGCIHWLVGTKVGTPINDLWTSVGALGGVGIYNPDSFLTHEYEGVSVHLYRDLERLQSSWLELSPEDESAIKEFCRNIKKLHSFEIPVGKPMDMMTLLEKTKLFLPLLSAVGVMNKYDKISLKQYSKTFKHPALQDTLSSFVPEGYSASSIFFALASFTKGQASIPYGGSKALAARMLERYLSLGGTVAPSAEVVELTVTNNRVEGVVCGNGKAFEADYIIAACDAHVLYEKLLHGKYPDKDYQER